MPPSASLAALALLAAVVAWFGVPILLRRLQTARLRALCAARRTIVLTYDDGPGAALSPRLAEILRRHGVRATFFAIGGQAVRRPAVIATLLGDGHEVANHSHDHVNAWRALPWRAVRDIRAGRHVLAGLGGNGGLFRPPYGKSTPATLLYGWRARIRFAYWTVDSRDSWETPRPVAEVLDMVERDGGGVVLMHDFDRAPRGREGHDHQAHVLRLTESLIDHARRHGYAIAPLGEMLLPSLPARPPALAGAGAGT